MSRAFWKLNISNSSILHVPTPGCFFQSCHRFLVIPVWSFLPNQRLNRYCASYLTKCLLRLSSVTSYAYYHCIPKEPAFKMWCFQESYLIIEKMDSKWKGTCYRNDISSQEDKRSCLWLGPDCATFLALPYWFLSSRPSLGLKWRIMWIQRDCSHWKTKIECKMEMNITPWYKRWCLKRVRHQGERRKHDEVLNKRKESEGKPWKTCSCCGHS